MRDDSAAISRLCAKTHRWETEELTEVHGRRYLLRDTALEFFFTSHPPVFLNFPLQHSDSADEDSERAGAGVGKASRGSFLSPASQSIGTARSDVLYTEVGQVYRTLLSLKSLRLHKLTVLLYSKVQGCLDLPTGNARMCRISDGV